VLALASALAAVACGSSSGGGNGTQGLAGKEILVGFSTPKTGPYVVYDQDTQAMIAFFKTVNAAGGINGYKYKWKEVDNQGSVQGGATAARNLLAAEPFAIVNIRTASYLGAVQALKTNPDIPVFSLTSGAAVKESGLKNVFGLYTDYTEEAEFGVEHLISGLNAKKIGLITDQTLDPTGPKAVEKVADDLGAEISRKLDVTADTTNYAPVVQKMRDSDVDAIYVDALLPAVAGVMKAVKAQGLDVPVATYSGNLDPQLIELAGASADGLYLNSLYPPLASEHPELDRFKTATDKYDPTAYTGQGLNGWAAAVVFNEAVKRATDAGDLDWDSFKEALYSMEGEEVGFAKISYSKDSHAAIGNKQSFTVYQVKGGKFVKTDYTAAN